MYSVKCNADIDKLEWDKFESYHGYQWRTCEALMESVEIIHIPQQNVAEAIKEGQIQKRMQIQLASQLKLAY